MTVENISIAVKTTGADTAARHISSLVASLEKLEKATASMTGVANLAELGKAFSTLASNRVSVSSFNSIAKGVERLGEALKSLSVEDAHILDKVTASMARLQGVDLKGFGSAVGAAQRVGEASQQAQMAVSEDVQSIIENASQVDVLTHKLDGLKDALQEAFDTGNIEKAYALRGQILQVEDAIKRATEAAKKSSSAFGSFFASLKRIAMYRALRTIIKAITQAIKEGIDNLYEYSKAHDDFAGIASSFDGLASAAQTMKNQLGATFGQMLAAAAPILIQLMQLVTQLTQVFYPLTQAIAAIEPVVSAVISVITDLINAIISLFDLLGLNVGKIVADDATKSWKDAKEAAGDYKNTILGFDEINRLNSPGGGGGGGGGGDRFEISEKDMPEFKFEWVAVFQEKIEKAKKKVDELAQSLNKLPKSVAIAVAVTMTVADAIGKWLENPQVSQSWVWNFEVEPQINSAAATEQYQNFIESLTPKTVSVEASVAEAEGAIETYQKFVEGLKPSTVTVEAEISSADAIKQYTTFVETLKRLTPSIVIEPQISAEEAIAQYNEFRDVFKSNSEEVEGAVTHLEEVVSEKMEQIRKSISEKSESSAQDAGKNFDELFTHSSGKFEDLRSTAEEKFEEIRHVISTKSKDSKDDSDDHFGGLSENAKNNIINLNDVVGEKMGDTKAAISTNTEEAKNTSNTNFGSIEQEATDAMSAVSIATYNAMDNFGSNIAISLSTAASNFGSWVRSIVSGMADWAKGVVQNLKAGIDAFKSNNPVLGTLIFGTDIGIETNYATAPLIPAWIPGGFTSAIPVFADGGIHDLSMGSLFVAGEAGAEIVTNMGGGKTGVTNVEQMKEAVREGNFELLNVVQGGINIIVKAINEIDPDITLDGQSLADSMYHYNKQAAIRYGAAMVT